MKHIACILFLLVSFATSLPTADAQMCAGTLYNNLIPGDTAVVVTDVPLNVRSEPALASEKIAQLEPYTELPVIDGPVCADGYAWYHVQWESDQTGWVVESDDADYWLGKLPRQYVPFERPADPAGHIPSVRFTYPEPSITRIDYDSAALFGSTFSGEQIILRPLGATEAIFITTIPFEDFAAVPGGGYDRAEVLQILVEEWSDVALDATYAYPHSTGAWPTIVALKQFQEFQSGRGFSYIAAYIDTENLEPVDRDSFWYVFNGVTDDEAYFVSVAMPIQTPQLPEAPPQDPEDMTAYFAGYLPWIRDIRALLQEQNGASFSPMLGLVQGIVYSLEIE